MKNTYEEKGEYVEYRLTSTKAFCKVVRKEKAMSGSSFK